MNDHPEPVHLALKRWRAATGMTQAAAGRALNVNPAVISQWENGRRAPSRSQWPGIAATYDVAEPDVAATLTGYRIAPPAPRLRAVQPVPPTVQPTAAHTQERLTTLLRHLRHSAANAYGVGRPDTGAAAGEEHDATYAFLDGVVDFLLNIPDRLADHETISGLVGDIALSSPERLDDVCGQAFSYVWRIDTETPRRAALDLIERAKRVALARSATHQARAQVG